jgi:UDP-N-acetylglucosamine acyltransferase
MSISIPGSLIEQGLIVVEGMAQIAEDVIVHPSAYHEPVRVGENCEIASGAVLYGGAVIGANSRIGHHTVIGAGAIIGRNSRIGHGCVIGDEVRLGDDNRVEHQSVIVGRADIGARNQIGPFATIGTEPQHPRIQQAAHPVRIGNDNVLREYVSVHGSTEALTLIGNGCYLMAYSCINHDVVVEDHVTMANNCHLAGNVHVLHHANLGMGCVIHQHSVVGACVMLGMGSIVTKDVPPFLTFYAGKARKLNRVGIQRMGHSETDIEALQAWYRSDSDLPLSERTATQREAWWYEDVQTFLAQSHRKICDTSNV